MFCYIFYTFKIQSALEDQLTIIQPTHLVFRPASILSCFRADYSVLVIKLVLLLKAHDHISQTQYP